ncbi:hypothetical protein HO173_002805 [Letharia columbiana]|uniref:Uncharacterized protein n=1 Tax=Letharia columbiana TaxID=112416 RepID=A0A8H6G251_9LECA|nr:uncharacterized protein HO173_002805 [Letharia columbiana]KAF6238933.1 hypothetical protein HO173_002805 [Letharia columbiana]
MLRRYQQPKLLNMTKPRFVLVPGAWIKPDIYSSVMEVGMFGDNERGDMLTGSSWMPSRTS